MVCPLPYTFTLLHMASTARHEPSREITMGLLQIAILGNETMMYRPCNGAKHGNPGVSLIEYVEQATDAGVVRAPSDNNGDPNAFCAYSCFIVE